MDKLIAFVLESPMPGMGGWGNGYVALPKGHPCYGMDYDSIYEKYDVDVNGGLTYAGEYNPKRDPEETKGMWIIGFDTLHFDDDISRWPKEAVLAEANRLKEQMESLVPKKETAD